VSSRSQRHVYFAVENGDALTVDADVLALKHAQSLHGVDRAVVDRLAVGRADLRTSLPKPGGFRLFTSGGSIHAGAVLFIGVETIREFGYAGIRDFGKRVLSSLASAAPDARHVAATLHGPGYGLDESEAFKAEIAGLLDAVAADDVPASLERVTIVEQDPGRARRLTALLAQLLPDQAVRPTARGSSSASVDRTLDALSNVGRDSEAKSHVFVAMPFAPEFNDHFHYGIQRAVYAAGLLCERADLSSFTGDVVEWVRRRIESASLLIADLSTANPNVCLEIGYAWGRDVQAVLVARDPSDLPFDVRGQRCLMYKSIQDLEEQLKRELRSLSRNKGPYKTAANQQPRPAQRPSGLS
jgi:hypothetical protein